MPCTHIEGRPTGPLVADRGSNLLTTPPPAGFFPPLLGRELRRKETVPLPGLCARSEEGRAYGSHY